MWVRGKSGEESGAAAVEGAQETVQGSRCCATMGNSLVYQIDVFSVARRFTVKLSSSPRFWL